MLNNQKRITRAILVCSTLTLSAFLLILSAGQWPWASVQAAVFQLSGKVSDQSGTGLLNARLDVIDPANNNVVATTNTGAGGNYSQMISGGTYNLRVTPPTGSGLQSAVILNRVIGSDTTIDFTLVPVTGVVTLSGKVTGPLGNPLAGITVDLGSFIMTTTNASGDYSLTTAAGNYPVKVRGGDSTGAQHLPSGFDFETNTSFALTQNTTLDIPLNFTKQVSVHVQDPQGNPVANAVVNTGSSPYNFNLSIGSLPAHGRSEYYDGAAVTNVTNVAGDALLWLFPAQGYGLTAKPPNGAPFGSATVSGINVAGDASLTITLVPLVTLSGKVTGPLGNPLSGITVDLGSFIMTTTNASGDYSLSTPAANYPVKVRGGDSTGAQHLPSGFDMQTLSNFALTQNTTLDIPLNFTKQVTVHVQDPQGNPVANAVVNTGSSPYNNNLSIGSLPAQGRSEYYDGGAVTNVTNAAGDALLWLFPAQGYSLTAKPANGAPFGSATVGGINIAGDASHTITLVPLVTLSGKVTGPLGNPLAGITVDLGSFIMTTTNASGNYSISTPAANYPVKVRGGDSTGAQHLPSGFDMQTLSNFALTQNTTLDIPLNFTKRVTVHVQDPLGNPVANTVINTGSSPYNNNLSIGPLPAQGRSEYYDGGAVTNVTNASGDAVLWLFPAQSYGLTAKPPTGSPYTPFTVSNVSINADKTIVIALSYACQTLTVNPATLPVGAVGASYSQVFTQTGGTGSVTFSLSGALPTGLSFAGNKLEGIPQQSGSFPITVIALDQNQCAGIRDYILNICSTITVNPPTVAAGTVGMHYNQIFTQSSGAGTVHFMFSGLMPDGLNFSGNTLAGVPSTPGTYNFTITATDANGCTGMRGYTLTVNCQPITVNPPTIPAGTANTPYSQIFTQTSGAGTVHFMFSGLMPDGLNFSGNTLAGAPSTPGTYNFTVTATDANGCTGMRDYTLNVACVNNPSVANNADSGAGSLRQAIASACAGSTITFANTVASPITLASELAINKNLTIQGPGANLMSISGNNVNRVFYIAPAAAVTIDKLTITQGYGGEVIVGNLLVARGGGGIFNQGNLTLTNSTVTDNTANGGGDGGGIYNLNGTVAISHSTISNNTTSYYGGGIFNNGNAPAVLTLTDSTVSGNSTGGFRGGGIVNVAGQATLTNSTVSGNTSTGQGAGGIWNWIGGTLTLINSTVSGNTGNGYSGGIRNTGSTLILINSTVSGNRDIDGSYSWVAGGIGNDSGPITIKNSIIANNTINANNSPSDCAGAITSQGYNLIKNTSGATITPAQPTDIFGVDPLLGPLANNGGPTQTMELLPGSPAIDKGSAATGVTTDQRGLMRPMDFPFIANATGGNGADIGAFETQTLPNMPPVINGYNITRQQGSPGVAETIAVVSDDYTPAGAMNVIPLNSIAGITITNILNTNGAITANVAADCTAPLGNNAILLQVTDGSGLARTSNLGINVTANTPAALGVYPPAGTINVSASATVMPNAVPSDNGTISSITASAPGFTGSFSVDSATGIVTISNAGPAGNYVVTVTATDNCGTTASKTFSLAVTCPGATIIVTGAADGPLAALAGNGRCDLREAITAANTNTAVGECPAGVPGLDTIYFALGTSMLTINVTGSALPSITEPLVIDGSACQSMRVELNGAATVPGTNGLTITAGNSTIRGLVINRFRSHGIRIDTGGGNVIENCFIGTDASGTLDRGNVGNGIFVNASSNNRIGGTSPGQRNLISGNDQVGLEITVLGAGSNANNNVIQGNFIGTDVSGAQAIGNIRDGIFLSAINASLNVIGGTTAGAGNLISGNGQSGSGAGIALFSSENQVLGNLIGTDITNSLPLGNYDGIRIKGDQNVIGGTAPGAANFIGYSGNQGVWISNGTRNSILSNSIFSNSALGIDLGQFGVTPNDSGDGDNGTNNLQNFPVLAFAAPTGIQGALNSTANTAFTVQFFSNSACDSSGNGEGRTYLGQLTNVTTDGGGNASFSFTPAAALTVGAFITATATDPNGNTSEFSVCRIVTATPPPMLSINDKSVTEGSSGTVNAVFTVSLSAPSTQTVTVQIATADGTAISPGTGPFADYVPPNIQMLTFPPNTLTQTFTVPVLGDTTFEPNETFFVNLSSPANATLAKAIGQGIINNDDGPPLLSITNATVTEGNGGAVGTVFTVILSNASYQPITVQYATADATATAPSDYVAQPLTTLTFPAHTNILTKIITVPVKGDTTVEPNETFFVNLSNPTPSINVTVIDNQGLGTILNDDNCSTPIANAGTDQNFTIIGGLIPVTLNGTASSSPNGGPLAYQWRNGTMVLGSGATLTVTLPVGTHTITLVVTDQCSLPAYDTVVIKIGKNIFTGTNVTAQIDPVTVNFANVAVAGAVFVNSIIIDEAGVKVSASKAAVAESLTPSLNGTSALPNGYSVFDQFAYDVSTTATVSGPITACFNEPTAANPAIFASLRVLHEEGGALVDRTILPPDTPAPDFNTRTVCARTNTLGLFVVARLLNISPVLSYASPQTVISGQTSTINPNNGPSDSNGSVASIVIQSVTPGFGGSIIVNNATGAVTISNAALLGSYTVTIRATDNDGAATDASFTLNVTCPAVRLPASPLVAVQAGVSYSASVAALPAGTYTYTLLTGSLPAGLTLNTASGLLSGMPAATGAYNFTVKAQAANGCGGTQACALSINCPAITLSALPTPVLSTAYNQTVTATPAGGNYSFAVTAGSLPPGLTLNPATGGLSGTPASSGTFTFTIRATGFGGCTGSKSYTVVIGGGNCPAITLPASLPGGSVGTLYSNSATASPSGSYTYTATGALPPGVTLYSSVGLLFGYPTTKGTFTFTITATGSNNCTGSKQYTVVIGGAGLLALAVNDFNGDHRSDFVLWGEAKAQWLILDSATDEARTMQWGKAGDVAAPGDYDGDGKADLAVFGKDGHWLIRLSNDGATEDKFWGLETDAPVPGDYDGDGKTDIAVWRGAEAVWYILRSSDGQTQTVQWGTSLAPYFDVPVPGDYDGDGKTDVAVFRQANGHWYIRRSSDGQTVDNACGVGTDIPVPGDYDGDGSTDIAVWRGAEGAWYIIKSGDGVAETKIWGAAYEPYFDAPAVGDYDGDGKTDIAVWRKSEGRWHILQSSDGARRVVTQGRTSDKVVTATPRR